ncbi:MAG: tetratricopeptide repeat protein [Candidatus Acidiferrales bacterium]
MNVIRPLSAFFLSGVVWLGAQEAPLLSVLPRAEEVRQRELRADLQMIRKNYGQAIELYQQALRFSPENAVLLNKIGIAYHQSAQLAEAQKYYEHATRAQPAYAQAWNNLGTVYYARKNYRRAIRHYERALKEDPTQAAVHGNLGTALFARRQYARALAEFQQALLLNPEIFQQRSPFGVLMQDYSVKDRARFHYLLAKSLASLGRVERALFYLRRAREDGYAIKEAQGDAAFDLVREDRRFQELFQPPPAASRP